MESDLIVNYRIYADDMKFFTDVHKLSDCRNIEHSRKLIDK